MDGELGDASGNILVFAELTSLLVGKCSLGKLDMQRVCANLRPFILASGVAAGVASDGIGRRLVYATGLAVCALATASSPSSTTYTQILMWRCLFSVGGGCAATMMTPILADYCHEEDRGRGAGLLGAAAGTGAVVSALVLLRVPDVARQLSGGTLPPDKAVACGYYSAATVAAAGSALAAFALIPDHRCASRGRGEGETEGMGGEGEGDGGRGAACQLPVGGGRGRGHGQEGERWRLAVEHCREGVRECREVALRDRAVVLGLLASFAGESLSNFSMRRR